jgi:hypothetical protein
MVLSLADIENLIFFVAFVRFAILAIRYNLKTSFYITMYWISCFVFMVSAFH